MSESGLLTLFGVIGGMVIGICGHALRVMTHKAHDLALAVLEQNKEITALKIEVAVLEQRLKNNSNHAA